MNNNTRQEVICRIELRGKQEMIGHLLEGFNLFELIKSLITILFTI